MSEVVGLDGWKRQWVAIHLVSGRFASAGIVADLSEFLVGLTDVAFVGIDIPIGFANKEPRRADVDAARMIGPRRSSVFLTPPREVLEAETYTEARQVSRDAWGRGVTAQAFALRSKVLEVDALSADGRLMEIHPEVSFCAMSSSQVQFPKKSWAGQQERRTLLADQGIVLPDDLGDVGVVPADDILDAAACAWSADRRRTGLAQTLPLDPRLGEPIIWF